MFMSGLKTTQFMRKNTTFLKLPLNCYKKITKFLRLFSVAIFVFLTAATRTWVVTANLFLYTLYRFLTTAG
jgi:hypothetical protein